MGKITELKQETELIEKSKPMDYEGKKPKGYLNAYSRKGIERSFESAMKKMKIFLKGQGQLNMDDFWHLRGIFNELSSIFPYGIGKDVDGGFEQLRSELIKAEKDFKAMGESLDEARLSGKDIPKMIKAIKDLDEKTLLKYMAMDKKNMFAQRHLMAMVDDKLITKEEAKKLGILSIGVGHALGAIDATLDANKKARIERAMERVKEVESM
jgi:hypothetical protein